MKKMYRRYSTNTNHTYVTTHSPGTDCVFYRVYIRQKYGLTKIRLHYIIGRGAELNFFFSKLVFNFIIKTLSFYHNNIPEH